MALSEEIYRKIFVEQYQLIKPDLFDKLLTSAIQLQLPLEQILIDQAHITDEQYLKLLSEVFKLPVADLKLSAVDTELFQIIPKNFAEENIIFPFDIVNNQVCVAVADPSDSELLQKVSAQAGQPVQMYIASQTQIKRALILYEGDLKQKIQTAVEEAVAAAQHADSQQQDDSSIMTIIEATLAAALLMESSDVHIQPYEHEVVIRFRSNGSITTFTTLPAQLADKISVYLKIKTKLKIDEKRQPQDGRCTYSVMGQQVNIRLSTLPSIWGESIVMRLLGKDTKLSGVSQIGLLPSDQKLVYDYLKMPHGMILVTGPTNSGKSTTLYAFLQQIELDKLNQVNITTIEDPVEYSIPGVVQVQVDDQLSFANGLRAMLRQDLDVLMVGEIRDQETAELSIRAALAGRLVLSTLHTNDAFGTIPRLIDIGVPAYLVASTVDLIISQRLAKRLCASCRKAYSPDNDLVNKLVQEHGLREIVDHLRASGDLLSPNADRLVFYHAEGCDECGHSGTNGRIGLYETLAMTDAIRNEAYQQADSSKMREAAVASGFKTMFADGVAKVLNGDISIEELFSVDFE